MIPDICKDLSISAIPVREALHRLETTGFVEILSHRGVYVKKLSYDEFEECKETRLLLEKTAIEKAATKIKPDAIEFSKSLLDRYLLLLKSDMLLEAREVHKELHFTLYRAAQSNILMKTIDIVLRNFERYRYTLGKFHGKEDTLKEHQIIIDACAEHNPKRAGRALVEHIEKAARRISSSLHDMGIL